MDKKLFENAIKSIKPEKMYSLRDIVKNKVLPGVQGYSKIYGLTHVKIADDTNGMQYKQIPSQETTPTSLKAESVPKPWNTKISGKLYVKGEEMIKYLRFYI